MGYDFNEFIETQREINRDAFEFAHRYVQGLVVVGYAAMFFLWNKTEGRMPPVLWSGISLLLCISVGTYLAWEVFAFLFRQRLLMRQASAVGKPGEEIDAEAFHAVMQRNLDDLRNLLPRLRAAWYPAMFGIVVPIALAWAVLLAAFAIDFIRIIYQTA
ncbi:hypothetical protein [Xanthomonas albilineans]|uniref:Transmembrane protein n=1 Tax=Xanthomonas albilineans (strain GPE PC73 / CFBP 7063) TaxID=380358 RepID=D2UBY8_XANAP|nr:hypothetical protein [Xanthomonas albilineans]QHQ27363.1 hypothetical protein XaFJ1_GM000601 [Xanthomonas albilineans]CBA15153.1 hypothetical protein XALC_0635 [Xanthomonas albilineans GPE PC73]